MCMLSVYACMYTYCVNIVVCSYVYCVSICICVCACIVAIMIENSFCFCLATERLPVVIGNIIPSSVVWP